MDAADATRLLKGVMEQMLSTLTNAGRALEARDQEEASRKPFLQQRVEALKALLASLEREKVSILYLKRILFDSCGCIFVGGVLGPFQKHDGNNGPGCGERVLWPNG
jgi:hypothetical protein